MKKKKTVNKLLLFLNLFIFLSLIASLVTTAICATDYTVKIYASYGMIADSVSCETENGCVEVTEVTNDGPNYFFTVVPKSPGSDEVKVTLKFRNSQVEDQTESLRFWTGPFNTLFSFNWNFDFKNSYLIEVIALIDVAAVFVVMLASFIKYLKKSDFGYAMVGCGGVALFCLFYLVFTLFEISLCVIDGVRIEIYSIIFSLATSGIMFTTLLAPFMAVFCLALIISNLSLIRHEGFRIVNLLGIILSVLWFAGFVTVLFFDENSSGSEFHGMIFTSISYGGATVISYFECMLFSTVISAYLASRRKPPLDRDYIVILGCAIRRDGTPTPILRGRIDSAIAFAREQLEKTGRSPKFVPSGGKGADEVISEGESMERYLKEQGIEEDLILAEKKSVNTFENIKLSREIIENDAQGEYNAAFATTNYHVFRGYILSKKLGLKNARGISAKTKWYFFPNAFLREFVGLIVDEWKKHLFFVLLLVASFWLFNMMTFW